MDALAAAGGVPVVVTTLKESAFDIRKEAAYALANICAGNRIVMRFTGFCICHLDGLCARHVLCQLSAPCATTQEQSAQQGIAVRHRGP